MVIAEGGKKWCGWCSIDLVLSLMTILTVLFFWVALCLNPLGPSHVHDSSSWAPLLPEPLSASSGYTARTRIQPAQPHAEGLSTQLSLAEHSSWQPWSEPAAAVEDASVATAVENQLLADAPAVAEQFEVHLEVTAEVAPVTAAHAGEVAAAGIAASETSPTPSAGSTSDGETYAAMADVVETPASPATAVADEPATEADCISEEDAGMSTVPAIAVTALEAAAQTTDASMAHGGESGACAHMPNAGAVAVPSQLTQAHVASIIPAVTAAHADFQAAADAAVAIVKFIAAANGVPAGATAEENTYAATTAQVESAQLQDTTACALSASLADASGWGKRPAAVATAMCGVPGAVPADTKTGSHCGDTLLTASACAVALSCQEDPEAAAVQLHSIDSSSSEQYGLKKPATAIPEAVDEATRIAVTVAEDSMEQAAASLPTSDCGEAPTADDPNAALAAELAATFAALSAAPILTTLTAMVVAEAEAEAEASGSEFEMLIGDDLVHWPGSFSTAELPGSHAQQPSAMASPETASARGGLSLPGVFVKDLETALDNAQNAAQQFSPIIASDPEPYSEIPDASSGGCSEGHSSRHSPAHLVSDDLGVTSSSTELFRPQLDFSPAVLLGTAASPPPGVLSTHCCCFCLLAKSGLFTVTACTGLPDDLP